MKLMYVILGFWTSLFITTVIGPMPSVYSDGPGCVAGILAILVGWIGLMIFLETENEGQTDRSDFVPVGLTVDRPVRLYEPDLAEKHETSDPRSWD